ncbi:MAG: HEAT repeat domain-containing protein [Planctomycetota bacterium]
MPEKLELTLSTLKASRNEASVHVLLSGLERKVGTVFEGALRTLLARRSKNGHLAALRVLHQLQPEQFDLLETGRGRLTAALRDALLHDDEQLFENACTFLSEFNEYDSLPTLLVLCEEVESPRQPRALALTKELADRLGKLVYGPRDEQTRRDPEMLRHGLLEQFEASVGRYRAHQQDGIVEAYVMLAVPTSSELRAILGAPHHACYRPVIQTLTHSECVGVLKLLFGFLASADAPSAALKVIGHRDDPLFTHRLAAFVREGLRPNAQRNLKRIASFSWLEAAIDEPASLTEQQQVDYVELVPHSGAPLEKQFALFRAILEAGGLASRVAACKAVAGFESDESNRILAQALDDNQPEVQSIAAAHARQRRLPGTLPKLLRMLDSPHAEVRDTVRKSLSEFNFQSFAARFESMNEDLVESTAKLVRKVDPNITTSLVTELQSSLRSARLRAISMAVLLSSADEVAEAMIELLQDPEHVVRVAAADGLQHYDTPSVRGALRLALRDKSRSVQATAESSLAALGEPAEPLGDLL